MNQKITLKLTDSAIESLIDNAQSAYFEGVWQHGDKKVFKFMNKIDGLGTAEKYEVIDGKVILTFEDDDLKF